MKHFIIMQEFVFIFWGKIWTKLNHKTVGIKTLTFTFKLKQQYHYWIQEENIFHNKLYAELSRETIKEHQRKIKLILLHIHHLMANGGNTRISFRWNSFACKAIIADVWKMCETCRIVHQFRSKGWVLIEINFNNLNIRGKKNFVCHIGI
jgi:hypothetical protein